MKRTFIRTTTSITAHHPSGKKPTLVGVDYYSLPTGEIMMVAKSGRNGAPIKKQGTLTITAEQYKSIPEDSYDSMIEARAALRLLGWEPCI